MHTILVATGLALRESERQRERERERTRHTCNGRHNYITPATI